MLTMLSFRDGCSPGFRVEWNGMDDGVVATALQSWRYLLRCCVFVVLALRQLLPSHLSVV